MLEQKDVPLVPSWRFLNTSFRCTLALHVDTFQEMYFFSQIVNNDKHLVGFYLFFSMSKVILFHNSCFNRRTICANGHNAYKMRKVDEEGQREFPLRANTVINL